MTAEKNDWLINQFKGGPYYFHFQSKLISFGPLPSDKQGLFGQKMSWFEFPGFPGFLSQSLKRLFGLSSPLPSLLHPWLCHGTALALVSGQPLTAAVS